jgi:hypothetical protein
MTRIIPIPDELSKPFEDSVNNGRLTVQSYTIYSKLHYPVVW